MNEPLSRAERIQAESNAASAAQWSRWADDIGTRLAKAELRLLALLGDANGEIEDGEEPALHALFRDASDTERKERAAAIGRIADVLSERLAAEVSVLDERFSQKLDSKIFDAASIKRFKADVTEAGRVLKADVTRLCDGYRPSSASWRNGSMLRIDAVDPIGRRRKKS
jgi:hypothetical protein